MRSFKHNFEDAFFEFSRVDAVAMERLTASPYVVNMYGYCGMTVSTEFVGGMKLAQRVDPLSSLDKLKLARQVAQGLADIHSVEGGTGLVHNDLNFANLVFPQHKDVPVLNDFNLAVLVLKNKYTGKPCPFTSHFPNPQWRSPEEQLLLPGEEDEADSTNSKLSSVPVLTNKIDIYALGNILFRFATGKSAWKRRKGHKLSGEEFVHLKRNGTMPPIRMPQRLWEDPPTVTMIDIMRECYSLDPNQRPTAQEIVATMDRAIAKFEGGETTKIMS